MSRVTLSPEAGMPPLSAARRAWWWEPEVVVLVLMVLAVHMTRLTDLSARGEETRRGRIAWEMLQTGEYLVPRIQDEPRLTRPPLHYWTMALSGAVWGGIDAASVRLPSVLATLLTVLLIYGYGRTFLSRLGAFGAAAAFATMGQVLELGRLGETEAVFTLLMSGALLSWHWGYSRGWPMLLTWTLGYGLAGLATLAKGPQGPVYFVGGVGAFLLLQRQWRQAFTRSHLVGIVVGASVVAAWQIPFTLALSADEVSKTYTGEVIKRFGDTHWLAFVEHAVTYPLEIAFGCLMPWSLLLFAYADRNFRARIGPARSHVAFLVTCLAVAFPTVWFPPQSNTRYFMPLYPCFALLVGLVIDRLFATDAEEKWKAVWPRYLVGLGAVMLAAAVAVPGVSLIAPGSKFAQPLGFAAVYALVAAGLAGVMFWSRREWTAQRAQVAIVAVAAFLGLTYVGVVLSVLIHVSEDAAGAVAALRGELPRDVRLSSFDGVNPDGLNHVFTFHYQQPIERLPWPKTADDVPADVEYFCFDLKGGRSPALPFAWEEVGRISCDRNRKPLPEWEVVVGRRIGAAARTAARESPRTSAVK